MAKKETTPKADYTELIKYEEELTTINSGSGPILRRITKTPYLEHHGYKIYLSKTEAEQIAAGKLNPEDLLNTITEEVIYKYSR